MLKTSEDRSRFLQELQTRARTDGVTPTPLPGVSIYRASRPGGIVQAVYRPNLCIVAQGRKLVSFAGTEIEYNPMQYLTVSLPLPLEGRVLTAHPDEPFLALLVDIDPQILSQIFLDLEDDHAVQPTREIGPALCTAPVTPAFQAAALQLLSIMDSPQERRILTQGAMRALLFYALQGPCGRSLQTLRMGDTAVHRIGRIVRYIDENYAQSLDVKALSRQAGMSESSFAHGFKGVTKLSPIQYLKQIRLHNARLLMHSEGLSASDAAFRVGYNSPSQFSREFKRMFLVSPSEQNE